jgi:hypothetical protein
MKNSFLVISFFCFTMFGCSSNSNYFSLDAEEDTKDAVLESLKVASNNKDNPQKAVKDSLTSNIVDVVSTSLADRFTNQNSRTNININAQDEQDVSGSIVNVMRLGEDTSNLTEFIQSSILYKKDRTTINIGGGQRYLSSDEKFIYGGNVFIDYAPKYGHKRASMGFEIKNSAFELTANKYFRLSTWKKGANNSKERVMNGHEIEIGGQVPFIPAAKLFVKNWKWDGNSDVKGYTYSLQVNRIINNFTIEAGVKDFDGSQDSENFAFLTYRISLSGDAQNINEKPFFSDNMFESTSVKIRLLEEVRRSNEIVYESDFSTKAGGI